jgi:type I phosphodiesterase/nucleotide pyrophosphatase
LRARLARASRTAACSLAALGCAIGIVRAQDARPAAPERPRLVVMIAIDQMTPEQLDRLGRLYTGGLGRFLREGLVFPAAALEYGDTETGPGHASYGTGLNPVHHGIVGNDWVLPEEEHSQYCVADPDVRSVIDEGPQDNDRGRSPKNLRALALCDLLERADSQTRSLAISCKDRAAIAMSGQHPDLALWWDTSRGGFQSSTWYVQELPAWVREFDGRWLERFRSGEFARGWTSTLPADLAGTETAPDEREGEVKWDGSRAFPHAFPSLSADPSAKERSRLAAAIYASPAGDQLVLELARRAVEVLELGADEHTDILCLSLSACDTVGHAFGPYSRETTDVLLRADRELGELFALLDEKVGRGRWVASLSADHGVMDLPEALQAQGIGAERIPGKTLSSGLKKMRARLKEKYGDDFYLTFDGRGVRLSERKIAAAGQTAAEVRRFAADALLDVGASWLEAVWTLDELRAVAKGEEQASGWKRCWANSFDDERTPDLTLQIKPWHLLALPEGTTHGTPYPYDRRIPLAFLGGAFRAERNYDAASSIDAVPTLLEALGLAVPEGLDGKSRLQR